MRFHTALVFLLVSAACGVKNGPPGTTTQRTKSAEAPKITCGDYVIGTSTIGDYLCAHNGVRARAQPAPSLPLVPLTWNDDLAKVATAYAQACTWGHNEQRSDQYNQLHGSDIYVGENLHMSTAATVTPNDAVTAWASEAPYYDYATNSCAPGQMCGHYTQLVWDETREVGCGAARCASVANSDFTNAVYIVCDYAPGGNIQGVRPY